jgi:hypothetical protein
VHFPPDLSPSMSLSLLGALVFAIALLLSTYRMGMALVSRSKSYGIRHFVHIQGGAGAQGADDQ